MTNFSSNAKAESVLDRIFELISEDTLIREVDDPIDCSAVAFELKVTLPITHETFNLGIAAFIRYLYQNGLRLCRFLTDEQALSEGIFILNNTYENDGARGYDGALLDATGKGIDSLEMVLTRLVEATKTAERAKYIKWVFAGHVYCENWKEKVDIVGAYFKQNTRYLPGELINLDPARLADYLPDLIVNHMSGANLLLGVSRAERKHKE